MINPSRSIALLIMLCALSTAATADVFYDAYQHGLATFKAKDYANARIEFMRAYDLRPDPIILYSIAQTYRLESNLEQALYYYKKFLAESRIAEDLRKKAEAYVAKLEAEQSIRKAKVDEPVPMPPNDPNPVTIVPCCVNDRSRSRWGVVAVGTGGLALLGSGLGFELWAESKYAAAKSEMTSQARRGDLYNSANTKRYVAEAFSVGGLAAGGAAVWLYLRDRNRERDAPASVSVHVVPTPTGLAVLGQF